MSGALPSGQLPKNNIKDKETLEFNPLCSKKKLFLRCKRNEMSYRDGTFSLYPAYDPPMIRPLRVLGLLIKRPLWARWSLQVTSSAGVQP